MANRYEYIECNDTCPTSPGDVYFAETAPISHSRADIGKKLSGFDSLWTSLSELEEGRSIFDSLFWWAN